MRRLSKTAIMCGALASIVLSGIEDASANPMNFTVDPANSSLTLTVTSALSNTFYSQVDAGNPSANGFVTSYSGLLRADVTASSFQLLGASSISADEINNWTPGTDFSSYVPNGSPPDGYQEVAEPAAYGIIQDLTGTGFGNDSLAPIAIRNLTLSLEDASPKPIAGGMFSDAGSTAALLYDMPDVPLIYLSIGGIGKSGGPTTDTDIATPVTFDALGDATLESEGNLRTLTLPVGFDISLGFFYNYRFEGVITATATVPEPTSTALAGSLVLCFAFNRRARNQG